MRNQRFTDQVFYGILLLRRWWGSYFYRRTNLNKVYVMAEEFTAETLLTIARDGLHDIGYRNDLLREKYQFADMLAQDQPLCEIGLAAFAQEPPSYRNDCIGVSV